ncbi:MAG: universal stress protein [Deltaproteobacteria bacterium]|nr:universal stress protein [Deltaproteobacteria bacterium]
MKKHFLITATEQESSNYGVRFFGHFFENKKDIKVTLFYTVPRPPAEWEDKRTIEGERRRKAQAKQYQAKGQKALDAAKVILGNNGFKSDQIATKVQTRMLSKAGDIIHEGSKGKYDALVIGPRGLSWFEEAFDESVSKEVLKKKYDFPLWLCRMPDLERKNVLVCLDGSDPAYRIADHVGFVLQDEKKHRVTLLRIKKDSTDLKTADIFEKALKQLTKNSLPDSLIDTKEIEASDPAEAILEEAEKGKYAVVAAGWTGAGKGTLQRIFSGSNSYTLFRELEGASLWTCY